MADLRISGVSADFFSLAKGAEEPVLSLKVREVYSRTINLEGQGGRRYSIVTSELDFGPRSALTDEPPRMACGERVYIRAADASVMYDPKLPAGGLNERWAPLLREWSGLLEGELAVIKSPATEGRYEELTGLGPGSTPAGDDFMAGFVSGCMWTGRRCPPLPDLSRTTWLSGEILRDAADGLVWRRGRDVISALSADDAGRLQEAAGRILNWGSTSGRAWLAGLSAALTGGL